MTIQVGVLAQQLILQSWGEAIAPPQNDALLSATLPLLHLPLHISSSPPLPFPVTYRSARVDKVQQAGNNALGNDVVPAFWPITSDVTKGPHSLLTDMGML